MMLMVDLVGRKSQTRKETSQTWCVSGCGEACLDLRFFLLESLCTLCALCLCVCAFVGSFVCV